MAAWTDLPSDLLDSIFDRLDIISGLRSSVVCTTWASTVRPRLSTLPPFRLDQPIPWLLISVDTSKFKPDHTDFTFYDVTTTTLYCISSPISFFSLDCPRLLGSNSGWLVFIDLLKFQLHLISPLTGVQLFLPSIKLPDGYRGNLTYYWDANLNALGGYSYDKVIICRMPDHYSGSATRLLLLCLFRPQGLAVLKVGDDKWTWLDLERYYEDAIVYQGKIYAIEADTIHCWELKGSSFKAGNALTIRYIVLISIKKYLVESGDKLLMVCRNWEMGIDNHTMSVYKLDLDHRCQLLSPIKSIDNSMFIGPGYSCVVRFDVARENCIYFVDDDYLARSIQSSLYTLHDSGVYNLNKKTREPFPVADFIPLAWFWPCDIK